MDPRLYIVAAVLVLGILTAVALGVRRRRGTSRGEVELGARMQSALETGVGSETSDDQAVDTQAADPLSRPEPPDPGRQTEDGQTNPPQAPLGSVTDAHPSGRNYRLEAPVELWFGEVRMGVKAGSRSHEEFARLADELLTDLRNAVGDPAP